MTKHFQATHDGHTFTRSSENRIYLYAIIGTRNIEATRLSAIESGKADWRTNAKWHRFVAQQTPGIEAPLFNKDSQFGHTFDAERIAQAVAYIAGGEAACIERALARHAEHMARAMMSSDGKSWYTGAVWASRLDLAQKQAKDAGDLILPAVEVARPARANRKG